MELDELRRDFEAWKSRQPNIVEDADLNYLGKFLMEQLANLSNSLMNEENAKEIDNIRNMRKSLGSLRQLLSEHSHDITHKKRQEELSKIKIEKAQIRVNTYPKNPIFKYLMTIGIGIIPPTTAIFIYSFDRILSNLWLLTPFIFSYIVGATLIGIGLNLQYQYEKNKFKLYQDVFGFGDHRNPYLNRKIKKLKKERTRTYRSYVEE